MVDGLLLAAAIVGAVGVLVGAVRRWIVRPITTRLDELRSFTRDARNAGHLAQQVAELAGAMTTLAVALIEQHSEQQQRLDDIAELVVDLNADLHRVQRDIADLQMTGVQK